MKRFVGSKLPTVLSLALVGALGCGGGDKGGDTTPASSEPPAEDQAAAEDQAQDDQAAAEGEAPADESAPAGGGLTEQLAQAQKVWGDACVICHGDKGEGKGKKNPAVVGGKALAEFQTGGELLSYVKEKMPKDSPGSLSDEDYLAVTAWMLSQNGRLGETNDALTVQSAASIKLH
jgi:mono/diheme cytochrome c family protein